MKAEQNCASRLVSAVVIAAGLAVAWAACVGWSGMLIGKWLPGDARTSESLSVAAGGTPLIRSETAPSYLDLRYRTLDGKPWDPKGQTLIYGRSMVGPQQPPGLIRFPKPWSRRIGGMGDGQSPPTVWFFVDDVLGDGKGYFVGFDARSKLVVGYIGRKGRRPTLPPQADWFGGDRPLGRGLASTGYVEYGYYPQLYDNYDPPNRIPQWFIYLVSDSEIAEVDLREGDVRSVFEHAGLLDVTIAYEAIRVPKPLEVQDSVDTGFMHGTIQHVAFNAQDSPVAESPAIARDNNWEWKLVPRLLIRTVDAVHVTDPSTAAMRKFTIPEKYRRDELSVYLVQPNQLLLSVYRGRWRGGSVRELTWIAEDGSIQRQERLELGGRVPPSTREEAWRASLLAPIPVGWLFGITLGVPLHYVQMHRAPDFASGLLMTLTAAWPPMLIVLTVAALLAWHVSRRHRKYFFPHAGVWAAFVFLFGPVGLAAYWLEHRRQKCEPCGQCGTIVPRDHDACAACGTLFPEPALLGTEILS
jgi:hypothetical protein